jgi:hypothetical protein
MRSLLAAVLCLLALPVAAQHPLQGQWLRETPSHPSYQATVVIDAQGRAVHDAKVDHVTSHAIGYVKMTTPRVEIVFTNRKEVSPLICHRESPDRMSCISVFPDGRISVPSIMTRVGPGPASLMPASR